MRRQQKAEAVPMEATACKERVAVPARVEPSIVCVEPSPPPRLSEGQFRASPLAATIVRVALAIEERERQTAVDRQSQGSPGARDSRGANEDDDFLNLPIHLRNDKR